MKCKRFVKERNKYTLDTGSILFRIKFNPSKHTDELKKVIAIQNKINREIYRIERKSRSVIFKSLLKKK